MLQLFIGVMALISISIVGIQFYAGLRRLHVTEPNQTPPVPATRYRPMLRLLSDDDMAFVSGNKALTRKLRGQRRQIFRSYLRCLAKDYGRLLAGIRLAMASSGVDRPDLARALAKNRLLFAMALYRIEVRLSMHALGIGTVDVSGLVEALDALRTQVRFLAPATFAA